VPECTFVEQKVTYALEVEGRFVLVENVPARVCVETGERYFAPETVERLQRVFWGDMQPARTVETPVFEFAA
jgi:YgiT-type zinc finger domain-containing protein